MGKLTTVIALLVLAGSACAYPKTVNTASLVGHWPMEEGSGTTTRDASGNGRTGTLVGSPSWVAGKFGSTLSLTGTECVTISDTSALRFSGTSAFSITAWVKCNSTTGIRSICTKHNAGIVASWAFWIKDGKVEFVREVAPYTVTGNTTVTTGVWHFVAGTFTGTRQAVYLDGVQDKIIVITGSAESSTVGIGIGGRYVSSVLTKDFLGTIDDVRIHNRALSASEIMQMYLSGRTNWSQ